MNFKKEVALGIPKELPNKKIYDPNVNHAPIRENVLTLEEKILALRNALRYFDKKFHEELITEFKSELEKFGRIYMYRFRPDYKICYWFSILKYI